jgi:GAF domain-containing protein
VSHAELTTEAAKHDVSQWTPVDFLLYGRYCEQEAISERLGSFRLACGSEAALLIAFRGTTVFRSLLLIRHEDPAIEAELRAALVNSAGRGTAEDQPWRPFNGDTDDPDTLVDGVLSSPALRGFASQARERIRALTLNPGRREERREHNNPRPAGITIVLGGGERCADEADRAEELLFMVNGSAPVVVHGNLDAERDVRSAISDLHHSPAGQAMGLPPVEHGSDADQKSVAQDSLEVALELTGSSVGNVYYESRDGSMLELQAAERNAEPLHEISIDAADSVVAWVHNRGRPMVINDINDFQRMPSHGYRAVTAADEPAYAELAVPILRSNAHRKRAPVLGVLNVEKVVGRDSGYFTYRDLTVLRLLAGRLGLRLAQGRLAYFSRSLAAMTRRNAVTAAALEGAGSRPAGLEHVPADAWSARGVIDETLRSVYELTPSQSATVRLISSDAQNLVRVSASPGYVLTEGDAVIPLSSNSSVNSWVARHGRPCYLPNLRARGRYQQYEGLQGHLDVRPSMRSELCLPIYVGSQLVGTLNLESSHRDAYADSLDVAQAICEQVAVAIARARRVQEQIVLTMHWASTANVHELVKCVDELDAAASENPALSDLAKRISQLIHAGVDEDPEASSDLRSILRRVFRENGAADYLRIADGPELTMRFSGARELIVRTALAELARNAFTETRRASGELVIRAGGHRTTVGGVDFLSLRIRNPIRAGLSSDLRDALYRVPQRDASGRLHIGAFTVGALIRSIGGEVYCVVAEPPTFTVRVDLPLDPSLSAEEAQ